VAVIGSDQWITSSLPWRQGDTVRQGRQHRRSSHRRCLSYHIWLADDLSLAAQSDAIDMDWYWNDKSRSADVADDIRPSFDSGVVQHDSRLDSFPLGAPVLKPDLYLNLAKAQLTSDQ